MMMSTEIIYTPLLLNKKNETVNFNALVRMTIKCIHPKIGRFIISLSSIRIRVTCLMFQKDYEKTRQASDMQYP